MIFAFLDDQGLLIHESLDDVVREHEAIDVENRGVRFFDAEGRPLEPVFLEANQRTKLLGGIEWVQQGTFTLKSVPNADTQEFRTQVLAKAAYLDPNPWFATLNELRERFGKC